MAITTNESVGGWNPSRTTLPPTDVTPDALVLNDLVATVAATPQGDATYIRVPFVPADPAAAIVKEGEEIPTGDTSRAEIRIYTQKIAIVQKVSREAYGQQLTGDNATANASDLFTDSLKRAVTAKADGMFVNAPEDKNDVYAPGLANDTTPAIIDGGNIIDNLDPLIDAIATIADNGATPACILTSNSGWARLQRMKYGDGRPVINPDAQAEALPQLAGLPVVRNGAVPANKLFVIDPSNIIVGYSDVAVDVDTSAYFTSDCIAIRVTARLGWGIAYRGRIARLTIGQDDTGKTTKKTIDLHVGA
ncbi:phage major capsid protein [Bifidobacterium saguinibicoloris]|uniref:phage major capsid protein n=1 Tax=Bifidobacterium saguinibicoloris TaxID=2834433 RepID=UPI001C58AD51|nr:phage major capsid protein [Bifidobacterium saguinibicoloris]MBW3081770.1 phage major capsid protein [Bifidobacterium saguinibicoloris]